MCTPLYLIQSIHPSIHLSAHLSVYPSHSRIAQRIIWYNFLRLIMFFSCFNIVLNVWLGLGINK